MQRIKNGKENIAVRKDPEKTTNGKKDEQTETSCNYGIRIMDKL